jgi:exonuclease III
MLFLLAPEYFSESLFFTETSPITPRKLEADCKNMLIMIRHMNIQCLHNKIGQLEVVLKNDEPDFLCLSEHWMRDDELKVNHIDGYRYVTGFSRVLSKNGGTAIFVHQRVCFEIEPITIPMVEEKIFECAACMCKSVFGDFVLIVLYRPPGSDFDTFILKLDKLLNFILTQIG